MSYRENCPWLYRTAMHIAKRGFDGNEYSTMTPALKQAKNLETKLLRL